MKTYLANSFGWKYNQLKTQAVIKKKSQIDFLISIIIAFFIIIIVSQLLGQLDRAIRIPLIGRDLSLVNPFEVNMASAASNEAFKMIESNKVIELGQGQIMNYTVGYKNVGKKVWKQAGSGKVDLRRKDSKSLTLKANLSTTENKSGQIGYFNMTLKAPDKVGTYKYSFLLVRNGKEIINGSEFGLNIKVLAKSQIITPKQTSTPVTTVNTNVSTISTNSLNKPVGLAEICRSIKPSDFKAAMVDQRLLDECLKIGIKVTDEGTSYIKLDQPTSSTAPEPNLEPAPTNPAPPVNSNPLPVSQPTNPSVTNGSNGPLVRIGLYNTTDPVIITANVPFTIKNQNGSVLVSVPANIQAKVIFDFQAKTYNLTANGTSLATSSYLRFEGADQNTVFEIISLNWRPTWNTSINYNKYLGALEVRYSPNTGKLWVINELELENYLKGLAESSNGAPIEYQKALLTTARTYAMYHYNRGTKHAAEYFTLDATYDQVYRGYNAELSLTQVSEAVEATKGQVITYNGEVVVTPYFSYDDGRTRSYQEVWGGSYKPWLVSVKEPAGYDKTTMYGHGVGLCARGAVLLAADFHYTFDQILKYYFTGIGLKKIY